MIGMVETIVERDGKTQRDRRYYLCSTALDAETFAYAVRAHWGVENRLHWVLDVVFHDDLAKNNIPADQLTLHADRGAPMKAKTTALMLADLGVAKSYSRPHTSNDNPFSEAHFKTLEYQPEFPRRFETIDHARDFCRRFFDWYNQDHHHAGIGLMTPDQVHYGQADTVHSARKLVLDHAFRRKPERFVRPNAPLRYKYGGFQTHKGFLDRS